MSYIEIRGLSKRFGSNLVLDNIDLDIEKGQVVALIGPSGTGKSTLLRCLNLLEKPENGTVRIGGEEYNLTTRSAKEKVRLRSRTEMVFQQFNLFKQRNALANVMEGLTVVKKIKKKDARKIALEKLDKVGMSDRLYHYPRHLSGGQQQRVAIARALAMDPELLLMDEPTSALDPELVGEVLQTVRKIASEGNTILLVTHEMNFVKSVASRVIFLENGKIVADGTASDVFEKPQNQRLKEFLININVIDGVDYNI
ncbi:MAG: amino acid ABC transporter ATP-binding protein [Lachnospiraceae bacterium]|nr:amino acid ABC transporter ATP-binding protein [Lachnospiraceae bacterium]